MHELFLIVAGGEYQSLLVGTYKTIEWIHLRLWWWFKLSTFIKEVN